MQQALATMSFIHYLLTNEQKIKDAVTDARQRMACRRTGGHHCYYGHGRVTDPTAAIVIAEDTEVREVYVVDGLAVKRIVYPERWLTVTGELWHSNAGTMYGDYMTMRYERGYSAKQICGLLSITLADYRVMGNNIRLEGERLGIAYGLMRAKPL